MVWGSAFSSPRPPGSRGGGAGVLFTCACVRVEKRGGMGWGFRRHMIGIGIVLMEFHFFSFEFLSV